jgi:hypothetical protein
MTSNTSVGKTTTTEASSIDDLTDSADTEELARAVTSLATEVNELRATVDEQQATIDEQEQTIDELERDLEETRTKVRDERGKTRHEIAKTRQDLADVEETVSQGAGVQAGETTVQSAAVEPQTDIESMTTMPETVLENQTANVRRAVFVAKDVDQYTRSCPAGRVIKSSELRRVLQAGTDCQGHTQTVARVIDLLDRTGGDGTKVVERSGERRLVFKQNLVDRLGALTSQSSRGGDGRTQQAT